MNPSSNPPPYSLKSPASFDSPLDVHQALESSTPSKVNVYDESPPPLPPLPEDMMRSVPFPSQMQSDYVDDKRLVCRKYGAWLNVILVISGADLCWTTFTFSYVICTWLAGICTMILPIVGIPLYGLFAVTWRILARIELILMSNLVIDTRPSPNILLDGPIFPELQTEVFRVSTRMEPGTQPLSSHSIPVVTPASHGYSQVTPSQPQSFARRAFGMMWSKQTWSAVVYFSFVRFPISLGVFMVVWCVFFPIWLLWGIFCGGFFIWGLDAGWWMIYPVVDMLAAQRRIAVAMLANYS